MGNLFGTDLLCRLKVAADLSRQQIPLVTAALQRIGLPAFVNIAHSEVDEESYLGLALQDEGASAVFNREIASVIW